MLIYVYGYWEDSSHMTDPRFVDIEVDWLRLLVLPSVTNDSLPSSLIYKTPFNPVEIEESPSSTIVSSILELVYWRSFNKLLHSLACSNSLPYGVLSLGI